MSARSDEPSPRAAGTEPRHRAWALAAVAVAAALALGGCAEQSMRDLERYTKEVLARPGKPPPPLPPIEPYEIYAYASEEARDPFEPFATEPEVPEEAKKAVASGPKPDFNRNREELESYALDSLRMMGTIEKDGQIWGIVRSPDSVIHRVQVGNYMGRNHGKIVDISEEQISLVEIVPDGQGAWVEREASLALLE